MTEAEEFFMISLYREIGVFHKGSAVMVEKGKWFHIREDRTPAYQERYDYVHFC